MVTLAGAPFARAAACWGNSVQPSENGAANVTDQVYINGRFLTQRVTGVQRYAREVLLELDDLCTSNTPFRLTVLAPPGAQNPGLRHSDFRAEGPLTGNAWEQFTLPRLTRNQLLVSFCPTGPIAKARQLITIHDASVYTYPESFSRAFRVWYRALLGVLVHRVVGVMTVSEFSRSEVIRYFGCPSDKLSVSVEGWQHILRPAPDRAILERHELTSGRYVLGVSSPTPSKNFGLLAQAIAQLERPPFDVVIAGAADPKVFGTATLPQGPHIKYVGYVSDGELRALYENAGVFVFPSRYEGFGLPPIEAMACGAPVVAAHAGAIPEVCGPGVILIDPGDAAGLAHLLERLLADETERKALGERGQKFVQRYSWQAAARLNFKWIEGALKQPAWRVSRVERGGIPRRDRAGASEG
jgi:glycosyltransferase involved in cell wall biosynthesis